MIFLCLVRDDFPRLSRFEDYGSCIHGLDGSDGSNHFEYWYVPISLLLPASGVLEQWAALEIGSGPKPYPSPSHHGGFGRTVRSPWLQKRQIGRLPGRTAAAFGQEFGGLWRSLNCYMEGYFGGLEGLGSCRKGRGMKCTPGTSWGSCGEFWPKRDSRCLQTGLQPQSQPCKQIFLRFFIKILFWQDVTISPAWLTQCRKNVWIY